MTKKKKKIGEFGDKRLEIIQFGKWKEKIIDNEKDLVTYGTLSTVLTYVSLEQQKEKRRKWNRK